jgi:hypothetical protein
MGLLLVCIAVVSQLGGACECTMVGQWRYRCPTCQHEEIYNAEQAVPANLFVVHRISSSGSWTSAKGKVYDNCTVSIDFSPGIIAKGHGTLNAAAGCRVFTLGGGNKESYWVRHVESTLTDSLIQARTDVLAHIEQVEASIKAVGPSSGSIGAYLLANNVYRKAAMFGIFNTTSLNEDVDGTTDQETELAFQCTGLPDKKADEKEGVTDTTDQAMWLRDSGAQMHFYVASGLAKQSSALTRVLHALLRQHVRLVLLDSWVSI